MFHVVLWDNFMLLLYRTSSGLVVPVSFRSDYHFNFSKEIISNSCCYVSILANSP